MYTFTSAFAAISPAVARVRGFRYGGEPERARSTGRRRREYGGTGHIERAAQEGIWERSVGQSVAG